MLLISQHNCVLSVRGFGPKCLIKCVLRDRGHHHGCGHVHEHPLEAGAPEELEMLMI